MPMNLSDYPKNWREISRRIRVDVANGRCQCRGECGTQHGIEEGQPGRCTARNGDRITRDVRADEYGLLTGMETGRKVVLTVAHLCRPEDHDPPAKCGDEAHLKAMCNACHLRLDHPLHVQHARETREKRQGVQEIPGFEEQVELSDGSQDVDGFAPLEGTPLPKGFRRRAPEVAPASEPPPPEAPACPGESPR